MRRDSSNDSSSLMFLFSLLLIFGIWSPTANYSSSSLSRSCVTGVKSADGFVIFAEAEMISISIQGKWPAQQPFNVQMGDMGFIRDPDTGLSFSIELNSTITQWDVPEMETVQPENSLDITANTKALVVCSDDEVQELMKAGALSLTINPGTSARQLVLTLVGSEFYSYRAISFRVIFLRAAFRAATLSARNLPFTIDFTLPPEETSIQERTRLLLAGTGLGALILSFIIRDAHMGLLSILRIAVLQRSLECHNDLGYVLNPLQISVGKGAAADYYGTIMTGFSLVILISILHALILRRIPLFIPYFPGDYWLLAVGLLCPISVACMQTLFLTDEPMRWSLALIILLLFYLAFIAFFALSKDDENVIFDKKKKLWYHKTDPTFISRWSVFYGPFKPKRREAFIVEVFCTVLLCGFSSIAPSDRGPPGCRIKSLASSTVLVLECIFLLVARPYSHSGNLRVNLLYRAAELVVAGAAVAASQEAIPNGTVIYVGQIAVFVGGSIPLVKYLVVALLTICGKRELPNRASNETKQSIEGQNNSDGEADVGNDVRDKREKNSTPLALKDQLGDTKRVNSNDKKLLGDEEMEEMKRGHAVPATLPSGAPPQSQMLVGGSAFLPGMVETASSMPPQPRLVAPTPQQTNPIDRHSSERQPVAGSVLQRTPNTVTRELEFNETVSPSPPHGSHAPPSVASTTERITTSGLTPAQAAATALPTRSGPAVKPPHRKQYQQKDDLDLDELDKMVLEQEAEIKQKKTVIPAAGSTAPVIPIQSSGQKKVVEDEICPDELDVVLAQMDREAEKKAASPSSRLISAPHQSNGPGIESSAVKTNLPLPNSQVPDLTVPAEPAAADEEGQAGVVVETPRADHHTLTQLPESAIYGAIETDPEVREQRKVDSEVAQQLASRQLELVPPSREQTDSSENRTRTAEPRVVEQKEQTLEKGNEGPDGMPPSEEYEPFFLEGVRVEETTIVEEENDRPSSTIHERQPPPLSESQRSTNSAGEPPIVNGGKLMLGFDEKNNNGSSSSTHGNRRLLNVTPPTESIIDKYNLGDGGLHKNKVEGEGTAKSFSSPMRVPSRRNPAVLKPNTPLLRKSSSYAFHQDTDHDDQILPEEFHEL